MGVQIGFFFLHTAREFFGMPWLGILLVWRRARAME